MKSYLRFFRILIVACVLGLVANASVAQEKPRDRSSVGFWMVSGYGLGYEMGPGMMSGYGMGPFITGWSNYMGLDLTAEQKSKIAQIRKDVRAQHWALMGKMIEAQEKLQELYNADHLDPVAINKQFKDIEDLRRQRREASIEAHNRIIDTLTKEQREISRKWGRGYHSMMLGY